MQNVVEEIKSLYRKQFSSEPEFVTQLPLSGSDRIYFRTGKETQSCIATCNNNIRENETFFYFTEHFRSKGCPVPDVLAVNDGKSIYLQEDLGDESLLMKLEADGYTDEVYALFAQALAELANMQVKGHEGLDYNKCITSKEFGKQAILSDLLYFKYYFLDTLKIPYDKEKLLADFETFAEYLAGSDYRFFMFRDFQSRNIMVRDDKVFFIDYQGGMNGALQYDVASLLWQAKAQLPDDWKKNLLEHYVDQVEDILNKKIDRQGFKEQYYGYVLVRLLQVLGAYGFRGIFERKAHFLTSIPIALNNLRTFITYRKVAVELPEFGKLLELVTAEDIINKFTPVKANALTPLLIKIKSFSYKIGGIPVDESENKGGFVFDCRGILNPGRFEEYKSINGRNKSVIEFLEQRTRMPEFMNHVYNVIDIAVENYLERDFTSLSVSFGCTGGCHRSVYAAEALTRHLRNKYNVRIELEHVEQHILEHKGY